MLVYQPAQHRLSAQAPIRHQRRGLGTKLLLLAVLLLLGQSSSAQNSVNSAPEVYITVFTHGTIHPHVNLQDLNLVIEDRIEYSHYYYVNE